MEANIAILIADLSGYTALTETHGASVAADLIDKYVDVVTMSLVGDSSIHQYTGDEVVIVSSSADHLASTAVLMMHNSLGEENFLQVHGGLHYGSILKRNNNFFGTTINLASRIASAASPGKFLCSSDFVEALKDRSLIDFRSSGTHTFKNLSEDRELYELNIDVSRDLHIDPVCRMVINDIHKALAHPDSPIYFCSNDCYRTFMERTRPI